MSLQDLLAVLPAGSPEEALARQVNFDRLPEHVAVIMDGNGRWAAQRHLPRVEGHRAGIESVRDVVEGSARVGIKVLKFQLGFNPTVISIRRGDTEYGIGALPLGGYVKMAGENPEEERTGRSDEFLSKSKWQRFQVLIMGPVMNLLLAVVLTAIVLFRGAEVPIFDDQPPVVGVVAAGSPAEKSDIRPGDRITSVAGRSVDTWEQLFIAIESRANREVTIGLLRNGVELTRKVTPVPPPGNSRFEIGDIGVLPNVHPHIPKVVPGDPAERAGVKAGDVVVAVNGQPITFGSQLRDAIATRPGWMCGSRALSIA